MTRVSPKENLYLLCYVGEAIADHSFVVKVYWANDHKLLLTFPVKNINKLKAVEIMSDNQKITLDRYKFSYRINLLKGVDEEWLYILLSGSSQYTSFDYTKDLQILIDYE